MSISLSPSSPSHSLHLSPLCKQSTGEKQKKNLSNLTFNKKLGKKISPSHTPQNLPTFALLFSSIVPARPSSSLEDFLSLEKKKNHPCSLLFCGIVCVRFFLPPFFFPHRGPWHTQKKWLYKMRRIWMPSTTTPLVKLVS